MSFDNAISHQQEQERVAEHSQLIGSNASGVDKNSQLIGSNVSGVDSSRALLGRIQTIREDLSHMSRMHNQMREASFNEISKQNSQER